MNAQRPAFTGAATINWFPGHMSKATRLMNDKLKYIDTVMEIRDARIPYSSANSTLENLIKNKKRLIVLNKADLADPRFEQRIISDFAKRNIRTISIQGNNPANMKKLITWALDDTRPQVQRWTLEEHERHVKSQHIIKVIEKDTNILVVGMPNVGKSTIINHMKIACSHGSKVAKTGPLPGVTQSISAFRIRKSPPAYMLDTPGVMLPKLKIEDAEQSLKLAVTGCIKDSVADEHIIASYLLYCLNNYTTKDNEMPSYVKTFKMKKPTEDIHELLEIIGQRIGGKHKGGKEDHQLAARYFLDLFRKGSLGKYTLDDIPP